MIKNHQRRVKPIRKEPLTKDAQGIIEPNEITETIKHKISEKINSIISSETIPDVWNQITATQLIKLFLLVSLSLCFSNLKGKIHFILQMKKLHNPPKNHDCLWWVCFDCFNKVVMAFFKGGYSNQGVSFEEIHKELSEILRIKKQELVDKKLGTIDPSMRFNHNFLQSNLRINRNKWLRGDLFFCCFTTKVALEEIFTAPNIDLFLNIGK